MDGKSDPANRGRRTRGAIRSDELFGILDEFARRLSAARQTLDVIICGGAALALTISPERDGTRDVDVFAQLNDVAEAFAADIAAEYDLPADWLNTGAQLFMSPVADHSDLEVLIDYGDVVLRVLDPKSLLAMKLRAGRPVKDHDDIVKLVDHLRITTMQEAVDIIDAYYHGEEVMRPTARMILQSHFGND